MRLLAIKMWHRALACGVESELHGRGGPHSPELSKKPRRSKVKKASVKKEVRT
jgi:hypothetical protein